MDQPMERVATGTVQGAAAREYPEYRYLKPILVPLDIFQLDPERLRASDEYPRSVNRPSLPVLRAKELADYSVSVGPKDSAGMHLVRVTLEPNEHTAARKPKDVFEVWVSSPVVNMASYSRRTILDEVLRRAFRIFAPYA